MTQTVVVALDLSESSVSALRYAFRLFTQPEDNIHVLRCIEEPPADGEEAPERLDQTNAAKRQLDDVIRDASPPASMISAHVVFNASPPTAITQLADKVDADLIVVGAGGKDGVECSFAVGSCADAVLRNSGRTVLVARASQMNTKARETGSGTASASSATQNNGHQARLS